LKFKTADTHLQGLVRGVAAAKVPHLVYSSVMSSDRWEFDASLSAMPHLRNKRIVNRLALELGVPTTVVGPSFFAENWDSPFMNILDGQV
jgi:uncharacterized protein YbjT (DUF2867 family)